MFNPTKFLIFRTQQTFPSLQLTLQPTSTRSLFQEAQVEAPENKYTKGGFRLLQEPGTASFKNEEHALRRYMPKHTLRTIGPQETFKIGKFIRVFVDLKKNEVDGSVMFRIGSADVDKKVNHHVYMRINAAKFICQELQGIIDFVHKNEGQLPNDFNRNDVLYEKSFFDKKDGYEYFIKLHVSRYRKCGDMTLAIYSHDKQDRAFRLHARNKRDFFIGSSRVEVLYKCLSKMIEAYKEHADIAKETNFGNRKTSNPNWEELKNVKQDLGYRRESKEESIDTKW